MNELNYGSQPACQRLVEAGIVLETEKLWVAIINYRNEKKWELVDKTPKYLPPFKEQFPAPSMAEVWRELQPYNPELRSDSILTYGRIVTPAGRYIYKCPLNTNPTDALIDLLIWAKKKVK